MKSKEEFMKRKQPDNLVLASSGEILNFEANERIGWLESPTTILSNDLFSVDV